MTIKEARKNAGLTQAEMSLILGIPKRTIEDWETGKIKPRTWAERLVVEKLVNLNKKSFKISNSNVLNYAEICKRFSIDTAEWGNLDEYSFYTTNGSSWKETSDNAHDGVDVSWAFHLTEEEIEMSAAEELYAQLMYEINLADCDNWDSDSFEIILKKFTF